MIESVHLGDDVTLYLGDCARVMADFPADSIDLTVTSPPYDNLRTYNGYVFDFEAIAAELWRVTKPGGVVVWVVGDATIDGSETGTSFRQALYFKELGFNLHDTMIYRKICYMPLSHRRYEQVFEYMFVFSKGTPITFNPIKKHNRQVGKVITGNHRHDGNILETIHKSGETIKETGLEVNVWSYGTGWGHTYTDDIVKGHPAPFPEALARDHILSWSNPGDVVLDPMAGSGTTGKMAVKYDRKFIGCEISEEYFDIAVKRIKEAQLQMRLPI
jgi:DNA modification methylase